MLYPTISMRELEQWIAGEKPMYLVDVRNRESYRRCHLLGAKNIPLEELDDHLEELPTELPVVFYCSRGSQSMLACNHLCDSKYKVVNVGGGLMAYRGRYLVRS